MVIASANSLGDIGSKVTNSLSHFMDKFIFFVLLP